MKMGILSEAISRFITIPIKIQEPFFAETEKKNVKNSCGEGGDATQLVTCLSSMRKARSLAPRA